MLHASVFSHVSYARILNILSRLSPLHVPCDRKSELRFFEIYMICSLEGAHILLLGGHSRGARLFNPGLLPSKDVYISSFSCVWAPETYNFPFLHHTYQCSGLSHGSALRNHPGRLRDHNGFLESNPGWPHPRQPPYLLCYL